MHPYRTPCPVPPVEFEKKEIREKQNKPEQTQEQPSTFIQLGMYWNKWLMQLTNDRPLQFIVNG